MSDKTKAMILSGIKKRLPVLAICTAIVTVCVLTMRNHYIKGRTDDLIASLEERLLDLRFRLRGALEPSGKIGILAIDEKSIQRFGRFPFSRHVYPQIFANLKKLGVQWIGLDMVFSEPERPELTEAKPFLDRLRRADGKGMRKAVDRELAGIDNLFSTSPADSGLANSISEFERLILGFFYYETGPEAEALGEDRFRGAEQLEPSEVAAEFPAGKSLEDYKYLNVAGLIANTEEIGSASENVGFFSNEQTSAVVRWVTMVRGVNGTLLPSLSLKVASKILGREPFVQFDDLGIESLFLVDSENEDQYTEIPLDPLGDGRILVNHLGPAKTITHFSIADAYDNKFTKEEQKKLKGMSLLLGPTAIGINDVRPNPFDASINGVENHAAVIDNVVSSRFMKRPRDIYETEMWICVGLGILFTFVMCFSQAAVSGVAAMAFLAGYFLFDRYYWFSQGKWVYMGMPFVQISLMYVTTTMYKYIVEEREKRKVKGAFQHYLSPEVVEEMLDDPDAMKLGGKREMLTIFFSDVRGFTTISENLQPEVLCDLMNCYFTPMTAIIKQHKGVVDKFIGDAIMAFWGAPVKLENHADLAAKSSIAMMAAMDQLRAFLKQKNMPQIDIGIGLNSGQVSVGNMGSDERFCYTVMGDHVNLASRLEGTTKEYDVKILISENTQRLLTANQFFTRDIDDIQVKGKNLPVRVFELMRPDYFPSQQTLINLIGEFNLGREAYRIKDFNTAEKHFKACFLIHAGDGPTAKYLKRIQDYRATPPPAEWNGVYVRMSK